MASQRIFSIQSLRFIAALLVVYFHAASEAFLASGDFGVTGRIVEIVGAVGIDIFFVISGFVIFRTARHLTVAQFIGKRARRILPLYLALAVPYTVVAVVYSGFGWREFLSTWLLWPATGAMTLPAVPGAWTLCFEALFYAAFAIVLWRPKTIWIVGAAYVVALALHSTPVLRYLGNPIVLEFLAGVGLAAAPPWKPAAWAIPIAVGVLVAEVMLHAGVSRPPLDTLADIGAWTRVAAFGIPAALIVWGTLQLRVSEGVLSYLGDTSYALYLIHIPIVVVMVSLLIKVCKLPPDLAILLAAATSVLVAWRVHELIEKPLMALWQRAFRAATPVAAEACSGLTRALRPSAGYKIGPALPGEGPPSVEGSH
jgi:exopolysaccharide production protein ExoZ